MPTKHYLSTSTYLCRDATHAYHMETHHHLYNGLYIHPPPCPSPPPPSLHLLTGNPPFNIVQDILRWYVNRNHALLLHEQCLICYKEYNYNKVHTIWWFHKEIKKEKEPRGKVRRKEGEHGVRNEWEEIGNAEKWGDEMRGVEKRDQGRAWATRHSWEIIKNVAIGTKYCLPYLDVLLGFYSKTKSLKWFITLLAVIVQHSLIRIKSTLLTHTFISFWADVKHQWPHTAEQWSSTRQSLSSPPLQVQVQENWELVGERKSSSTTVWTACDLHAWNSGCGSTDQLPKL